MRPSLWMPLPLLASPYKGEELSLYSPPLTESAKIKSPFSQIMREESFLYWPPLTKGRNLECHFVAGGGSRPRIGLNV